MENVNEFIDSVSEVKVHYKRKVDIETKVTCVDDAIKFIRPFFEEDIEQFEISGALLMDYSHKIIGFIKLGQGGVSATVVNTQLLVRACILTNAQAVILVHNHPSGNLIASESDKNLTYKIRDGLNLFDINLLDHVILTKNSHSIVNI